MARLHVYISPPAGWTEDDFRREAPECGKCGRLCRRWRWIGKRGASPGQYRCSECDA